MLNQTEARNLTILTSNSKISFTNFQKWW